MMVRKKKKYWWLLAVLIPAAVILIIWFSVKPPTPVNKYGEFPFRVVYEADGERFIIEDILICEYTGIDASEIAGVYLKWDQRFASGAEIDQGQSMEIVPWPGNEWGYGGNLALIEDVVIKNSYIGAVCIDLGSPPYYMGYYDLGDYRPGAGYTNGEGTLDEETLWEQYKVRIIETTFSEPLKGNGIDASKLNIGFEIIHIGEGVPR